MMRPQEELLAQLAALGARAVHVAPVTSAAHTDLHLHQACTFHLLLDYMLRLP